MKIFGIIPARYASTRLHGKPLAQIVGKPMIQHVYERASRCRRLDQVIVATDDGRILEAVRSFGGKCILTRSDHESGTDRLAEAAQLLDLALDDCIVNIQGDEPLVQSAIIDTLVEALLSHPRPDMATLAFASSAKGEFEDANVVKVVTDRDGRALYFSRSPIPFPREQKETFFLKHLGFYAYSRGFLSEFASLPPSELEVIEKLEQLRALENGYSIRVALSPFDSESVDTAEDLEKVTALLSRMM